MLDKLESVPYITIRKSKGCGDEDVQEYKTKEDAIKALKSDWNHLNDYDKKHTEFFYVLECDDPDPESVNHFDGNIILHVFGVYVGLDSDEQIRFFSSINDEELEFDEDTDVADLLRSASVIKEAANSLNITPEQRKYMLNHEWQLKEQLKECENYLATKHTGANIDNDMLRNRSKNL